MQQLQSVVLENFMLYKYTMGGKTLVINQSYAAHKFWWLFLQHHTGLVQTTWLHVSSVAMLSVLWDTLPGHQTRLCNQSNIQLICERNTHSNRGPQHELCNRFFVWPGVHLRHATELHKWKTGEPSRCGASLSGGTPETQNAAKDEQEATNKLQWYLRWRSATAAASFVLRSLMASGTFSKYRQTLVISP